MERKSKTNNGFRKPRNGGASLELGPHSGLGALGLPQYYCNRQVPRTLLGLLSNGNRLSVLSVLLCPGCSAVGKNWARWADDPAQYVPCQKLLISQCVHSVLGPWSHWGNLGTRGHEGRDTQLLLDSSSYAHIWHLNLCQFLLSRSEYRTVLAALAAHQFRHLRFPVHSVGVRSTALWIATVSLYCLLVLWRSQRAIIIVVAGGNGGGNSDSHQLNWLRQLSFHCHTFHGVLASGQNPLLFDSRGWAKDIMFATWSIRVSKS